LSEHFQEMIKKGFKLVVRDGKEVWVKEKPEEHYKPSRMVDVDTDIEIMNMSEVLNSVKDAVGHIENVVVEIADFLYRKDRKKSDRFKMKQLKRKAKKR
jgi:hypothetical protein